MLAWLLLSQAARLRAGQVLDPEFVRGLRLQQQGKLDQAIAAYELSIKLKPSVPALVNLGAVYAKQGRYEEAISAYQRALTLAPWHPSITLNLGLAHYKTGDYQKAEGLFGQVLASETGNLQARTLQADCFFRLGEVPEGHRGVGADQHSVPE